MQHFCKIIPPHMCGCVCVCAVMMSCRGVFLPHNEAACCCGCLTHFCHCCFVHSFLNAIAWHNCGTCHMVHMEFPAFIAWRSVLHQCWFYLIFKNNLILLFCTVAFAIRTCVCVRVCVCLRCGFGGLNICFRLVDVRLVLICLTVGVPSVFNILIFM